MKRLIIIMLILAVGLFMTGCKVTGGGWFEDGRENKCTFGFVAQDDDCCQAKGQFQFNDHFETKIHAQVYGLVYNFFNGEWTIRGNTKDGEEKIKVTVEDNGNGAADPGDYIKVKIKSDGIWKTWEGELLGGNIQEHFK